MSVQAVLLPLFVSVVLTFLIAFRMGYLRVAAARSGAVHPRDIALREPNWPPHVRQVENAYHNQLELPLLFYILTILALFTRNADLLFVLLAWVFVTLRVIHAFIHLTDNNVPRRAMVFIASVIVLAVMWGIFILRVLLVF
jgi:hypothetical protein